MLGRGVEAEPYPEDAPDTTKDAKEVEDPLPTHFISKDSTHEERDHCSKLSSWSKWFLIRLGHRHLRKIDWLMAHTTCLICLINTVNGCSRKSLGRGGASSGHIKNLKQSIFLSMSLGCAFTCFLTKQEGWDPQNFYSYLGTTLWGWNSKAMNLINEVH